MGNEIISRGGKDSPTGEWDTLMNGLVNPLEGMRDLFLLLRGGAPRAFIGLCGGLRIPYYTTC